jgi:hypothetical protein
MNLLLDPGVIPIDNLFETLINFSKSNSLHLINRKPIDRFSPKIFKTFQVSDYKIFDENNENFLNELGKDRYVQIIEYIFNDHRTILISERVGLLERYKTVHNLQKELEKVIFNVINFLLKNDIQCVMFQATPHGIYEWILGRVAEGLGISVIMIQTSPVPWRYRLVKGIDQPEILKLDKLKIDDQDPFLNDFIETNLSDYKLAIPDYEKIRIQSRKGKFWSWRKELKDFINYPRPNLLNNIFYKKALFTKYNNLTLKTIDNNVKNIVFFMHYQPERTSLPEGGIFAQQWLLIKALSIAMPKDWVLYVKEHPSIFTGKFVPKYRDMAFYEDIFRLQNVHLIPLEFDTFELIDNAMAIATITGTVGIQALIRGRPVLLFGNGNYKECSGVFSVRTTEDIEKAINSIINIDEDILKQKSNEFLHESLNNSIGAYSSSYSDPEFTFYNSMNRVKGHLALLEKLFNTDFLNNI